MAGMHHQSGWLVYHQQVLVFIHDVERDVFRGDFHLVARTVHHHRHHIARLDAVVGFHCLAVDQYAPRLGCLLDAVARGFLHMVDQEFVYPQQLLPLVGYKPEMLVEIIPAIRPGGIVVLLLHVGQLDAVCFGAAVMDARGCVSHVCGGGAVGRYVFFVVGHRSVDVQCFDGLLDGCGVDNLLGGVVGVAPASADLEGNHGGDGHLCPGPQRDTVEPGAKHEP